MTLSTLFSGRLIREKRLRNIFTSFRRLNLIMNGTTTNTARNGNKTRRRQMPGTLNNLFNLLRKVNSLQKGSQLASKLTRLFRRLAILNTLSKLTTNTRRLRTTLLRCPLFLRLRHRVRTNLTTSTKRGNIKTLMTRSLHRVLRHRELRVRLINSNNINRSNNEVKIARSGLMTLLPRYRAHLDTNVIGLNNLTSSGETKTSSRSLLWIYSFYRGGTS